VDLGHKVTTRYSLPGALHDIDLNREAHHGRDGAENFALQDSNAQIFRHIFMDAKILGIKTDQVAVNFGITVIAIWGVRLHIRHFLRIS
jgi:hypothetical protein